MKNEKYIKDLSKIKQMMNSSSRFISLSGLAGVFAGCYAIIGVVLAKFILTNKRNSGTIGLELEISNLVNKELIIQLFILAICVLVLAIGTALFLTTRKAQKNNEKIWDNTSKRLLINFFSPLGTGGIFCLVLVQYGLFSFIVPSMLIFYGLALIHASKYTFGDLKSLGYSNVILGLIATQFLSSGLYFWAVGFGLFHIVYGIWMYNKYDRKNA